MFPQIQMSRGPFQNVKSLNRKNREAGYVRNSNHLKRTQLISRNLFNHI